MELDKWNSAVGQTMTDMGGLDVVIVGKIIMYLEAEREKIKSSWFCLQSGGRKGSVY